MSAAATNRVSQPAYSHARDAGLTVNRSVPVGGLASWKREAIKKLVSFESLGANWDSYGSQAPSLAVRQTVLELLFSVPSESLPVPRVIPASGGGFHLEWSVNNRELEISVDFNNRIDALRVENGIPIEDEHNHY